MKALSCGQKILISFLVVAVFFTGFFLNTQTAEASLERYKSIIGDPSGDITHKVCSNITRVKGKVLDRLKEVVDDIIQKAIAWFKAKIGSLVSSLLGFLGTNIDVPVDEALLKMLTKAGHEAIQSMDEQMDCEKFMRETVLSSLSKRLQDTMVDDIVSWVQGNEAGIVRFIDDPKGFLKEAGKAAFDGVLAEVGVSEICEGGPIGNVPLRSYAENLLRATQATTIDGQGSFFHQTQCTLVDAFIEGGGTYQGFHDNFLTGGWSAFNAILLPQNNKWGLNMIMREELAKKEMEKNMEKSLEATAGEGYFGQRICLLWEDVGSNPVLWGTTVIATGKTHLVSPDGYEWSGKEARPGESRYRCIETEIITPGATIADSMSHALGADFNTIANADRLGEYAGAVVDSTPIRLFGNIYTGIKGLFSSRGEGTPSRSEAALSTPGNCETLSGPAYEACLYETTLIEKWDDSVNFPVPLPPPSEPPPSEPPPSEPPPSEPPPSVEGEVVIETWRVDVTTVVSSGSQLEGGPIMLGGENVGITGTVYQDFDGGGAVPRSIALAYENTTTGESGSINIDTTAGYRVGDREYVSISTTWNTVSLPDGEYVLTFSAEDGRWGYAGSISSFSVRVMISNVGGDLSVDLFTANGVDITAATIPATAMEFSGTVNLFASASYYEGVYLMEITKDADVLRSETKAGGTTETISYAWHTVNPNPAGPYPTVGTDRLVEDGIYLLGAFAEGSFEGYYDDAFGYVEVYNPVGCMDSEAYNYNEREDGQPGSPTLHRQEFCTYEVQVSFLSIDAGGTVTADGGINCHPTNTDSQDCSAVYVSGTLLTLNATPDPGNSFGSWGGDCSGTTPSCELNINGPKQVEATFLLGP